MNRRTVLALQAYRYPTTKVEAQSDLVELLGLIKASGHRLEESWLFRLRQFNQETGLPSGQLKKIAAFLQENKMIDLIVIDLDLKAYQVKKIEDFLNCEVMPRTRLILEIFRKRAHSKQGQLQVDLAEAQYELGRMVGGKGRELSRLGGGVGTRGPGEQWTEKGKRAYRLKIRQLKKKLEKVKQVRHLQQQKSRQKGYFKIALVGYTNAGKSTLLNQFLSQSEVQAKSQVFTTVDPTTRLVCLKQPVDFEDAPVSQQMVLITDTVGFISRLPHELVEGFESTLEQINESDLVLVVIDAADSDFLRKEEAVFKTLKRLQCQVPLRKVYNKFDQLSSPMVIDPEASYISAQTGEGIQELKKVILERLLV